MTILQIEHQVPSYEAWKKAFDSDPIGREKSGVKSYRVYRSTDDPDYVILDLEFENSESAQTMLSALRTLWNKVEGTVMVGPKARFVDLVESKTY